jgi:stress response protein YsnF
VTEDPASKVPQDDRTLIRSEERLAVSTRPVPIGTVRLERYQVTETRTITVDVLVDRIRMVTTMVGSPPTTTDDPPADPAASEVDGEGSDWVVLCEEQVTVTKTVVPVERVRLAKVAVTTEQTVTEAVRAERIEFTDPTQQPTPSQQQ